MPLILLNHVFQSVQRELTDKMTQINAFKNAPVELLQINFLIYAL